MMMTFPYRGFIAPAHIGIPLLGLFLGASAGLALTADREHADWGRIEYSDGSETEGRLSLPPGRALRLHVDSRLIEIPFETVATIRISPRVETLERKWTFPEAGRTRKVFHGDPYPVRHLEAVVRTRDGEERTGHVYTTPIYIESGGSAAKIVVPAKQRGKPGQTLAALVYPSRIHFPNRTIAAGRAAVLHIEGASRIPALQAQALTREGLSRVDGVDSADRHATFRFAVAPGVPLWIGIRHDTAIAVGWPVDEEPPGPEITDALRRQVAEAKDFFDHRRILAVHRDGDALYTLMLLARRGKTTLSAERNRPWQCTVWRWKQGPDGRLMLAAQGPLFRGIIEPGGPLPAVVSVPQLWFEHAASEMHASWAALEPVLTWEEDDHEP